MSGSELKESPTNIMRERGEEIGPCVKTDAGERRCWRIPLHNPGGKKIQR